MQAIKRKRGNLWRYNYTVLMGGGYWILVLPVAASQVVTLWMMALSNEFSQEIATSIAELMTPILGAFLVAHSMAPEYRSGIGAVLACKPVSLHRVVTMRVVIALLLPVLLTLITLTVCSIGLKPIDILPPLVASLPSLWFLSMLALTCATLFRNSLAGFAAAAVPWGLDVVLGYGVNPFLSARGLSAVMDSDPLHSLWLYGKVTLVIAGTALLWLHGRLLPRVCQAAERRDLTKLALTAGALVAAYSATGAAASVWYGYVHRANLPVVDTAWLRRQLSLYGPVPVSRLFGPAFAEYVAAAPPPETGILAAKKQVETGDGQKKPPSVRALQLQHALEKWPHSIWADSIFFALAQEHETAAPVQSAQEYATLPDRFPASPFAPKALARVVRATSPEVDDTKRLSASRRLLKEYPQAPEAEVGADYLLASKTAGITPQERLQAARTAESAAPRFRQPAWNVTLAHILVEQGHPTEARAALQKAKSQVNAMHKELAGDNPAAPQFLSHRPEMDAALRGADELLKQLDAKAQ